MHHTRINKLQKIIVSFLLPLIKIFGLFVILAALLASLLVFYRARFKGYSSFFKSMILPGLVSGIFWYGITGVRALSNKSNQLYSWLEIHQHFWDLNWLGIAKNIYGTLGWLDTHLSSANYVLALCILVSYVTLLVVNWRQTSYEALSKEQLAVNTFTERILLLSGIFYTLAILALEAHTSRFQGSVLQGRYLLPGVLAFVIAASFRHRLSFAFLLIWIGLSFLAGQTVLQRYFAGSLEMAWYSKSVTGKTDFSPAISSDSLNAHIESLPNLSTQQVLGHVDRVRKIQPHEYQIDGWFRGTEIDVQKARIAFDSPNFFITKLDFDRVHRLDLGPNAAWGFSAHIQSMPLNIGAGEPIFCAAIDLDGQWYRLQANSINNFCK